MQSHRAALDPHYASMANNNAQMLKKAEVAAFIGDMGSGTRTLRISIVMLVTAIPELLPFSSRTETGSLIGYRRKRR